MMKKVSRGALGLLCFGATLACSGEKFETASNAPFSGPGAARASDAGVQPNAQPRSDAAQLGDTCSSDASCASGHCVDGVCCDLACQGECEACAVPGHMGSCTAIPAGQDPDSECAGSSELCAGSCNGKRACSYPDASQACGETTCSAGVQLGQLCDGAGNCAKLSATCGDYACGSESCKTSCSDDTDCSTGRFCNQGSCQPKGLNGDGCQGADQCLSGYCVAGVCCGSECSAPASCATGSCECGEHQCAPGVACKTYFDDKDKDGFGDPASEHLDCDGVYSYQVENGDDCFDQNANAFPGQSQSFSVPRGDGSYDYDCDGQATTLYPDITGKTCGDCGLQLGTTTCAGCGIVIGGQAIGTMGFGCQGASLCQEQARVTAGYVGALGCGETGTLFQCSASACDTLVYNQKNQPQACR